MKRELLTTDHLGVQLHPQPNRHLVRAVKWGVIALLAFNFLMLAIMWYLEILGVITLSVIALALMACATLIWFVVTHIGMRDIDRGHAHPRCPLCKYDLHGLDVTSISHQGRRCPECGRFNALGSDTCAYCGYDLKGLPSVNEARATTCPECGHNWQLSTTG
jgi:hypothetical protein